ncbi:MAG: molybdopterin-dependent oxidoreductase [Candidatus Hatepunaea meridiana]|nr:molybdopterin-dependent oxidoreductase [Candidatus Hatepunaea meridiana]
MPKMKINGEEHEFPDGINVLQACERIGIDIPHFCYHPALRVAGSCRMCKVEVIQGGRKRIDISCNVPVQDGLEIITDSPAVKTARKMTLEFELANHPLDCPVCDVAGECNLQNYYMEYGLHDSRMNESKHTKHKATGIGRSIVHDGERCVLCSRCVRFLSDVTKTRELGIFGMGSKEELTVYPGASLDNDYAGNVVDLCPVGALTDKDFRFKRRSWFLSHTSSICQLCSRGCNVRIDYDVNPYHEHKRNIQMRTHRTETTEYARIQRIKPRHNEQVNDYWMCDHGRYGYRPTDSADRLLHPLLREDGELKQVKTSVAIKQAATAILSAIGRNPDKAAIIVSPLLTNEELFTVHRLFREKLNLPNLDHKLPIDSDWYGDNILRTPDPFPNRTGCEWIGLHPLPKGAGIADLDDAIAGGKINTLLSILADPRDYLKEASLKKLKNRFYILRNLPDELKAYTDIALPAAAWGEYKGTFTNFSGRIQRLNQAFKPLGEARPVWSIMLDLSILMKKTLSLKNFDDVFRAQRNKVHLLSELEWDDIGDTGVMALEKHVEAVA